VLGLFLSLPEGGWVLLPLIGRATPTTRARF
jgi:hypothetical protein